MSTLNKTLHLALASGLLAASVAAAPNGQLYRGHETPQYRVLLQDGPVEIRDYDPYLSAEVTVDGSRSGAANRGFRILAGYIFGGNDEDRKVAMTSPVTQHPMETGAASAPGTPWTIRFMMPRQYDADSLPDPDDPAVRIVTTPGDRLAVIRFSGRWTDEALRSHASELRNWAETQDVTLVGPPRYYFYDAPFTLPFNRRNEVAFRVQ